MSWRLGEEGFPWPLSSLQGDRLYLGEQNKTLPSESGPQQLFGGEYEQGPLDLPIASLGWEDLGEMEQRLSGCSKCKVLVGLWSGE